MFSRGCRRLPSLNLVCAGRVHRLGLCPPPFTFPLFLPKLSCVIPSRRVVGLSLRPNHHKWLFFPLPACGGSVFSPLGVIICWGDINTFGLLWWCGGGRFSGGLGVLFKRGCFVFGVAVCCFYCNGVLVALYT